MVVFAVFLYRVFVIVIFSRIPNMSLSYTYTRMFVSASAAGLQLIAIVVLNHVRMQRRTFEELEKKYQHKIYYSELLSTHFFQLYGYIALWLTNKEQPRTRTDFEQSYTIKVFLFQFINYYSSLIYIAFFKVSSKL